MQYTPNSLYLWSLRFAVITDKTSLSEDVLCTSYVQDVDAFQERELYYIHANLEKLLSLFFVSSRFKKKKQKTLHSLCVLQIFYVLTLNS